MSKKTRNSIISAVISIVLGLTMFLLHEGHMKKARATHSQIAASLLTRQAEAARPRCSRMR